MIRIENVEVLGWEHAIRGMRNPYSIKSAKNNSWEKSDSGWEFYNDNENFVETQKNDETTYYVGLNDQELMERLAKNGSVHAKYRRMIIVYLDITAPLYWWKEFDTYKVGTVANSCSTMHKIAAKEFTLEDFSCEHLDVRAIEVLKNTINVLNDYRNLYVNYDPNDFEIKGCPSKKLIWWQMIQLLPSSYNQKRTIMLNYEVLANIYHSRKGHKLDEWNEFCEWIESLPYSEIITGGKEK